MIFKYGTYAHANNEVSVTSTVRLAKTKRGETQSLKHTWNIQGVLQAASQSSLTTALSTLDDAYDDDGNDAGLYLDDGTTKTNMFLDSSKSIGGVRVLQKPSYPVGEGAEYSTFRTFAIVLEADFLETRTSLLDFTERLDFSGTGGPRYVFLDVLNGPPQRQMVNQRTVARVVQSGSALGHGSWPNAPAPKFPDAELVDMRRVKLESPTNIKGTAIEYRIDWQYTFEFGGIQVSATPSIR